MFNLLERTITPCLSDTLKLAILTVTYLTLFFHPHLHLSTYLLTSQYPLFLSPSPPISTPQNFSTSSFFSSTSSPILTFIHPHFPFHPYPSANLLILLYPHFWASNHIRFPTFTSLKPTTDSPITAVALPPHRNTHADHQSGRQQDGAHHARHHVGVQPARRSAATTHRHLLNRLGCDGALREKE